MLILWSVYLATSADKHRVSTSGGSGDLAADVQYHRSPCKDYVDSAVRQMLSLHVSQPAGDILCFMTGQEDIEIT